MHYDYNSFAATVSARIKAMRKERGLSQANMMQIYGYHLAEWHGIETGRRMSLRILIRVANTFDVTVAELVDGIEKEDGPGEGSRGYRLLPGSEPGE